MKVELQAQLFERYPLTLRKPGEEGDNPGANRPGPLDFWGIECGDGWFELLDRMLTDFEKHNQKLRKQGKSKGQWPRVLQIKEKFGSLRVYIEPYQAVTPKLHEAMVAAEPGVEHNLRDVWRRGGIPQRRVFTGDMRPLCATTRAGGL